MSDELKNFAKNTTGYAISDIGQTNQGHMIEVKLGTKATNRAELITLRSQGEGLLTARGFNVTDGSTSFAASYVKPELNTGSFKLDTIKIATARDLNVDNTGIFNIASHTSADAKAAEKGYEKQLTIGYTITLAEGQTPEAAAKALADTLKDIRVQGIGNPLKGALDLDNGSDDRGNGISNLAQQAAIEAGRG